MSLSSGSVVLALGGIAHKAVLRALGLRQADFKFGHASEYALPTEGKGLKNPGLTLLSSYHCSRYNTQTKRLTEAMFTDVFERARVLIG